MRRTTRPPSTRRSPGEVARNRFYNRAAWKKLRAWFLAQRPKCAECEKRGYQVPAEHCDHIIPLADAPERALDPSNVQGLCRRCHSAKTNVERTGCAFRHWSAGRVGVDGIPLDPEHPWNLERDE